MEEVRTSGIGMSIARDYRSRLQADSAFTYQNDFNDKLSSPRQNMPPYENISDESHQETLTNDPRLQSFTATGRPMPNPKSSKSSALTSLAGAESWGAGAPNLLPKRFTDDSIISVPVMPSEEEIYASLCDPDPIKDRDDDSRDPIKEDKRRFTFFRRKPSKAKNPPFVMKDMKRSEYLKYYAKDDDGNYIGTRDPAPDCILKNEGDMMKFRKQYAFREAVSGSPAPMSM